MSDRTIQDIISSAIKADEEGVPVNWKELTLSAVNIFQRAHNESQSEIAALRMEMRLKEQGE